MKPKLSLEEVFTKIKNREHFEAILNDGSAYIKIEEYAPFICFAIHNGFNLRTELRDICLLNEKERWYEEDPYTLHFISSMPIVISGCDTRYEYDLNREQESAVYETEAWGKKVWKNKLSRDQKKRSISKHKNFYKLVDAVLAEITSIYDSALAFDIHSFNYKRLKKDAPVFNIGTTYINSKLYRNDIDFWIKQLEQINLPNIQNRVAENEVFFGKGYLLKHITDKYENVLVFATEIKKIYCDEESGEIYPIIIDEITRQLKPAIINTTKFFLNKHTTHKIRKKNKLLSSELNGDIYKIDKKLYALAKNFEILSFVNPVNIEQEKREFFKSKYQKNPEFIYKQLSIDAFEFKRKLYSLPLESINDISLKLLYQQVIDSYADKVDIISSIGTNKFLYNCLRYFGEPNISDIKNAEYLLHFSPINKDDDLEIYNHTDVYKHFSKTADDYGFNCKIDITNKIVSKVQVINSKKSVLIRKDSVFSKKSLNALASHEIGVHMLTTMNALQQPLNIFRIGTPHNTHTQEGLAILAEYLSGNLTITRLHYLALRVMVINKMLRGYDFKQSFEYLMDQGILNDTQAFYLTARAYRGGGFTKDYLYLKGFKDILKLYNKNTDLKNLLIGKTSVAYLPLINEMTERKIFLPPARITKELTIQHKAEPIIDYVLKGLK
jgi:uncharacterized protein (TIGR02421 family)